MEETERERVINYITPTPSKGSFGGGGGGGGGGTRPPPP